VLGIVAMYMASSPAEKKKDEKELQHSSFRDVFLQRHCTSQNTLDFIILILPN
jgi:hypothetical protein